jgi:hypothetical protein
MYVFLFVVFCLYYVCLKALLLLYVCLKALLYVCLNFYIAMLYEFIKDHIVGF